MNTHRSSKNVTYFLIVIILMLSYSCSNIDVAKYKYSNVYIKELNLIKNSSTQGRIGQMELNINIEYDPSVRKTNYTQYQIGEKDTAVILLHGFICSPFEVYFLSQEINKKGYTVFLPLIEGFGGSTKLANSVKYQSWQSTLDRSIEILKPHYSKFVIVGFSLGGTIAIDFLLNQYEKDAEVLGAVLLSPYFIPKLKGSRAINSFFDIFTDSISLKSLYTISQNPDLLIPTSNPEHYNSEMPLKAVDQIIEFGKKTMDSLHGKECTLPTLFVYTEDDQTVDNEVSFNLIKNYFQNLKIIKYEKSKKIRHQLTVPAGNNRFDEFQTSVISFIENIGNNK